MKIDGTYWKTELFPLADRIESISTFHEFDTTIANSFERELMIAIFCIRTLIERCKLSEEILVRTIVVKAFPKRTGEPVTYLNSHDIDDLYDMASPRTKNLSLKCLCNQIVHSYILLPLHNDRQITNILVCSDFDRKHSLYIVAVPFLIETIREIASDYPSHVEISFNPKRSDYDVKNYR